MPEFIVDAFRNCIVGRSGFYLMRREHVLNAIKVVANTITVAELHAPFVLFESVQALIEHVGSFRRVKV